MQLNFTPKFDNDLTSKWMVVVKSFSSQCLCIDLHIETLDLVGYVITSTFKKTSLFVSNSLVFVFYTLQSSLPFSIFFCPQSLVFIDFWKSCVWSVIKKLKTMENILDAMNIYAFISSNKYVSGTGFCSAMVDVLKHENSFQWK